MRIIGGTFRGRRLASLGKGDAEAHLRPTSDRVRESLFNVLASRFADRLIGAHVLDLFAGTGALGLEALSRGAADVVFVENGRTSLRLLRENVRLCGAEKTTRILSRDVRRIGASAIAHDLVFLDPPYGKGLGEKALQSVMSHGWVARRALIVWEENQEIEIPDALRLLDERTYGDTVIRILETPD